MISAEVAIYPLKTTNATNVIESSINTLRSGNLSYNVNSMNTKLVGSKAEIFRSLESMFTEAENAGGELSMVVTITNSAE